LLSQNISNRGDRYVAEFFEYLPTPEIRKLIYTTNPIESFNSQLRRKTKNGNVFPNDMAILKLLYLAVVEVFIVPIRNGNILQGTLSFKNVGQSLRDSKRIISSVRNWVMHDHNLNRAPGTRDIELSRKYVSMYLEIFRNHGCT